MANIAMDRASAYFLAMATEYRSYGIGITLDG